MRIWAPDALGGMVSDVGAKPHADTYTGRGLHRRRPRPTWVLAPPDPPPPRSEQSALWPGAQGLTTPPARPSSWWAEPHPYRRPPLSPCRTPNLGRLLPSLADFYPQPPGFWPVVFPAQAGTADAPASRVVRAAPAQAGRGVLTLSGAGTVGWGSVPVTTVASSGLGRRRASGTWSRLGGALHPQRAETQAGPEGMGGACGLVSQAPGEAAALLSVGLVRTSALFSTRSPEPRSRPSQSPSGAGAVEGEPRAVAGPLSPGGDVPPGTCWAAGVLLPFGPTLRPLETCPVTPASSAHRQPRPCGEGKRLPRSEVGWTSVGGAVGWPGVSGLLPPPPGSGWPLAAFGLTAPPSTYTPHAPSSPSRAPRA